MGMTNRSSRKLAQAASEQKENSPIADNRALLSGSEGVGSPPLFAIGNRSEAPNCLVEQAVDAALDNSLRKAEALLLAAFAEVTLGELSAEFHHRLAQRVPSAPGGSHAH